MKIINYIIVGLLFLMSCRNGNDGNTIDLTQVKALQLNLSGQPQLEKLTSFASNIEYIKLKNEGGELVIGNELSKVFTHKGKLFLLDESTTNSVFVFNFTGDLIYSISPQGSKVKGQQYEAPITDITIDQFNNFLLVYCADEMKILKFNADNGVFIETIFLQEPNAFFQKLNQIDKNSLLLTRDHVSRYKSCNGNRFCIFDLSGKYIKGWQKHPTVPNLPRGGMIKSQSIETDPTFIRLYNDSLYGFNEKGLYLKYLVKLNLDSSLISETEEQKFREYTQSEKVDFLVDGWIETKNRILFRHKRGNMFFTNIYDRRRGTSKIIKGFINDINHIAITDINYMNDDYMISVISPESLIIQKNLTSSLDSTLNELVGYVDKSPNPIIAFIKLK